MNGLVRKNEVRLPRLFESFFAGSPFFTIDALPREFSTREVGLTAFEWNPSFEVKETGDGYEVKADLPGVAEKDLSVTLTANVLHIEGHRDEEHEEKPDEKAGRRYYVRERSYGSFARSFALPDNADGATVNAAMKDGVLTVTVAKRAEVKPRKVTVSTK